MFLFGTNLPDQKLTRVALRNIFGIGRSKANGICNALSLHPQSRIRDLSESQITQLGRIVENGGVRFNSSTGEVELAGEKTGHELQRVIAQRVKHYWDIGSWRGLRLANGLPARGQRSHPNGHTAGKRHGQFINLKATTSQ